MAEFDLVVRNGTLVTPLERRVTDVAISDGSIAVVGPAGGDRGVEEIDATGLYVLPGVIDAHVHFREPGLEHEETWLTGTRAAVMGGVTTVLDMPNTVPPTDTVDRARAKLALAAQSAYCDFGIFGLIGQTNEALPELARSGLVIGLKVFMGPTTGELRAPEWDGLLDALEIARDAGLRVAFHAEDREVVELAERELRDAGRTDAIAHLEARPEIAEQAAIISAAAMLMLSGAFGHIVHVSSAAGLAAVEELRGTLESLTCEVTPQHLFLGRDVYATAGGVARVNPPIRGGEDAAALRAALAESRITYVATDHAPHLASDKQRPSIWDVPSGFAGVETMLPLLLTHGVNAGWLSLEQLVRATSHAPARTWGLWPRKGSVSVGADADLTIVDLDKPGTVRAMDLHGLNNLSPFEGMTTRGAPVATIVRGQIVVRDGEMMNSIKPGLGRPVQH